MKKNVRLKKGMTTILASALLVSSIPSYGASPRFKDVPATHWAYTYVENMAKLGYISGTGNGVFSPQASLNFDAAMSLVARLSNPGEAERSKALGSYESLLDELKIESWAREGLAVCLYRDIISESQLRDVSKKGLVKKPIKKADISEYLVKAMGLEEEAQSKLVVALPFKDVLSIEARQAKYVQVLLEAGVYDAKGNGDGTFKPNSYLTRDVMAKMMSTAYDYMGGNTSTPTTPTNPTTPGSTQTDRVSGEIKILTEVGTEKLVTVTDKVKGNVSYRVLNTSIITVDDRSATYSSLAEGQDVELEVKRGTNEIVSLKAKSMEENISGKIKYINAAGSKMTVEYTEGSKTLSKEFNIDKNADIYLNDKSVHLNELKEGDLVDIKSRNNLIYDIDGESKIKKVEGIIKEITPVKNSKDEEYTITIVDSKDKDKDKVYEFTINNKSYITRNNRTAKVGDLKVKDEAYVEAEYNIVKDIDAEVVRKNIKGQIIEQSTRLHQNIEVTVLNQETKEEERYTLGKEIYIRVDKVVTSPTDLKTGYYIEALVEGDEIIEIEADSKGLESTLLGKIDHINSRNNEIILIIENTDLDDSKYGDEITVRVKKDAIIADKNLKTISFSYLGRGDRILIAGTYDGFYFVADTVQLRK
ncbi:S-layer homology domain-containing protein [Tissierella sp. MB52-C2]|uniref:S-layer homology domain-containing protein n=1 Tax=Tissierella sp. MB52-C2 TaxID=3070999 RepID=UPI00280BBDD0|nr:S-layer homology domain-containing protein [Tissierella sp. MB52-C2]WMM24270.1 S-layer homology domain-containing protein [Tissierella sp. MB52-C2]